MKITAHVLDTLYHPPEKDAYNLSWRFNPKIKRRRMPPYILEFNTWKREFVLKRGIRGEAWRRYDVDDPRLLDLLKSRLSPTDIAACIRTAILDDGLPF
ncbi:hypothetical protein HJB99_07755 [Rhizobium sp. NLR17b]|uniref:hypothetical protein n=1 Tax=Rhizobium sp. NLR17b TaxID=2731114 RepID=UPI001C82F6D6|nr:hypothetical protein [Rhizobium sp. NLR17b]MBX5268572.1 hypothetical protein [Rhizobium sp. NLR17b]